MGGDVFHQKNEIHNKEDASIAHKNIIKKDTLLYRIIQMEEITVELKDIQN